MYAKGTVREASQLGMPGRRPSPSDEVTLNDQHPLVGFELVLPQALPPSRDHSYAARNVASLAAAPVELQVANAYNRELQGVEFRSPLGLDGRGCVGTQALPLSRDHSYAASNVASLAAVPHELAIANAYRHEPHGSEARVSVGLDRTEMPASIVLDGFGRVWQQPQLPDPGFGQCYTARSTPSFPATPHELSVASAHTHDPHGTKIRASIRPNGLECVQQQSQLPTESHQFIEAHKPCHEWPHPRQLVHSRSNTSHTATGVPDLTHELLVAKHGEHFYGPAWLTSDLPIDDATIHSSRRTTQEPLLNIHGQTNVNTLPHAIGVVEKPAPHNSNGFSVWNTARTAPPYGIQFPRPVVAIPIPVYSSAEQRLPWPSIQGLCINQSACDNDNAPSLEGVARATQPVGAGQVPLMSTLQTDFCQFYNNMVHSLQPERCVRAGSCMTPNDRTIQTSDAPPERSAIGPASANEPSTRLEFEVGWFGTEVRPGGKKGMFKPLHTDLVISPGLPELILLRTTGVVNSLHLAAFNAICESAGLYSDRMRIAMLGRDEKQGYRVLLLIIDGEVRAGALFSLAQETAPGTSGAVLLDLLMLAVAEPYRFEKDVQRGRGYGSWLLDALQVILLRAAGVNPAYMLVRACSNARPFYEAKRGFFESPRATQYVKALRDWYGSHGFPHKGNHPELFTLLWSRCRPPPVSAAASHAVDAQKLLIERGAAAYCLATGIEPALCGCSGGATLRDGRVCIRRSPNGGKSGRGLFSGPKGLGPTDFILYSGEVISADEANARRARGMTNYILQLSYRADGDRIDGRMFVNAIRSKPDADGLYWPSQNWAYDAGPGCLANEDNLTPNAKFEMRYIEKNRDFGLHRVIVPLRRIEPGEEIRPKYGSKTPREDERACAHKQREPHSYSSDGKRKRHLSPHDTSAPRSKATATASVRPKAISSKRVAKPKCCRSQVRKRPAVTDCPQVLENEIVLAADPPGSWCNGVSRVSVPPDAATHFLEYLSNPTNRTADGKLRVGHRKLAGFDNWSAVEAGELDPARQRAHTRVISRADRHTARAHLPGLDEIVRAALQQVNSFHHRVANSGNPQPEWLHAHTLCQDDPNARFSVHQDTTEAFPEENMPPDRRVLYTVVIKLNEGGTSSMQVCGQGEVFYRRSSGGGFLFRSEVHHRTCRASCGVWKLALFFGHML